MIELRSFSVRRRWRGPSVLLIAASWSIGCSQPRTVTVEGRVTHDGKPVAGASVTFINEAVDGKSAQGRTDADGHYSLSTYFASTDIPAGAEPGDYVVVIEKRLEPDLDFVLRKMAQLGAKGNMAAVAQYIRDRAVADLWPGGIPAVWPPGYIPTVTRLPPELLENPAEAEKFGNIALGIPLLPQRYAQPGTSGFHATVEMRSDGEPLIVDLNLTGEVEPIELLASEATLVPSI